jgi:hypothetical protein
MPISQQASELLAAGRLHYGDPCYQPTWGSSKTECEKQGTNLATLVLQHYGIGIHGAPPSNAWTSCCPLDILNQDPFGCIKMSLQAKLLDDEYWEVYADEDGLARFIMIVKGSSPNPSTTELHDIQYCVPSLQPQDLVDMVIVRAADPPPSRACGPWLTIVDGSQTSSSSNLKTMTSVFPASLEMTRGLKFTWGQVNGSNSQFTSSTCDNHRFSQYGSIVYPDFERKQSYKDGIVDRFEVGPFQTIVCWLIDTDFGDVGADLVGNYSIQFTKSSEMPIYLDVTPSSDLSENFGPVCDIRNKDGSPGTNWNITIDLRGVTGAGGGSTCDSVGGSVNAAKQQGTTYWDEYSLPAFYGYARGDSLIDFSDVSKWDQGSNICYDNQQDIMYESTQTLMANGCTLAHWKHYPEIWTPEFVDLGIQKDMRTMDLGHSTVWMEMPVGITGLPDGRLHYALRAKAPDAATFITNMDNKGWRNPYWVHMFEEVQHRFGNSLAGAQIAGYPSEGTTSLMLQALARAGAFNPPGHLVGMDENLYTMHEFWAKATIARAGLLVQGKGQDAAALLDKVVMKAMPVYMIDFPAPVAAAGHTGFTQIVNPDTDVFDNMYCTVEENTGDTERLQAAMCGNTLEISLPFLYPNNGSSRANFDVVGEQCFKVATNILGYLDSFRNNPNKGMTYVCGPPGEGQVPQLGQSVNTPYGIRTINSITFNYTDQSSYTMTVDVGPISFSQASTGHPYKKRSRTEEVKARVVKHDLGAKYKVNVPGIGVLNAWNANPWPWDVGDLVTVTVYNQPIEL